MRIFFTKMTNVNLTTNGLRDFDDSFTNYNRKIDLDRKCIKLNTKKSDFFIIAVDLLSDKELLHIDTSMYGPRIFEPKVRAEQFKHIIHFDDYNRNRGFIYIEMSKKKVKKKKTENEKGENQKSKYKYRRLIEYVQPKKNNYWINTSRFFEVQKSLYKYFKDDNFEYKLFLGKFHDNVFISNLCDRPIKFRIEEYDGYFPEYRNLKLVTQKECLESFIF